MSSRWQLLLPAQIDPSGPHSLADIADCTSIDDYDSMDDAIADIGRYDAIIVRTAELSAETLARADQLKVIAKHGTGLDNIDINAASRHGIVVCNTPGVNARSVAEQTIALLFGLRRHLHTADRHVRNGGWDRAAFVGRELRGDTLGLMGFGAIARETATIAQGIGLQINIYDPHHADSGIPPNVERVDSLTALCAQSDAVSLHVPLTDETRHAIGADQLAALGADGVIINTARGGIIDESALVAALDAGLVGGAGLDNFEQEPPGADNPLYAYDTVLLTPHLGGVTENALERMSRQAADNVRTVYERALPESTVNREHLEGVLQ